MCKHHTISVMLVLIACTTQHASAGPTDNMWSREFSVFCPFGGEVVDGFSREFSVFCRFDGEIVDGFSREFSVFCRFDGEVVDGFSREFSVYLPPLALDIAVSPPGSGTTIPPICTVDYMNGEIVDITAIAAAGFDFDHWEVDTGVNADDPLSPCTSILMDDNKTVTAFFVPSGTIKVCWTGLGDGISWSDPGNWCPPVVPDETGIEKYSVCIDGSTSIVNLDISPTITTALLTNESVVRVNTITGSQSLTVSAGITSSTMGDPQLHRPLRAGDGLVFTINSDIDQTGGGGIEIVGTGSLVRIVDGTVTGGFVLTAMEGLIDLVGTASLVNVAFSGFVVPDGEIISLDGVAINVDTVFIDGLTAQTQINSLSSLTLTPLVPDMSELVLGDQNFAFLGDATSQITNETGHAIRGAGSIDGISFVNRGVLEAGPTALGGAAPETMILEATTTNDGTIGAAGGFTLDITAPHTGSGLYLANEGTINVFADLIEDPPGSAMSVMVTGGTMHVGDGVFTTTIDGCGPIDVGPTNGIPGFIEADNSIMVNAVSWNIGDQQMGMGLTATMSLINNSVGVVNGPVTVRQNGTLQVLDSSLTAIDLIVEDGGTVIIGSSVTLSGSLTHDSTNGMAISWAPGSFLTLTGGQMASMEPCTLNGWTTLEAASADTGPVGGVDDFAFAGLDLAAGAHVSLVDLATNHSPAVVEAVYCDSLTLGAGAVLNLNGLNLYVAGVPQSPGPLGGGTITDETRAAGGLLGDFNDDGLFDIADLAGFVDVLLGIDTDPVHACNADMNTDGTTDGGDIQMFVSAIVSP